MQFKTNAECENCSSRILSAVRSKFPDAEWSLDLSTADKVLQAHGMPEDAEKAAQVVRTIEETGFKGSWITRS